jgi:tetratricopeptide (TPR) repeat protein
VYEDRRQYGKALQHYQRATQSDPGSAAAFLRAGIILKQLKAYQDAGDMLKRAVEINPQDADAMQQLAAVRALELVHGGFSQTAVTP